MDYPGHPKKGDVGPSVLANADIPRRKREMTRLLPAEDFCRSSKLNAPRRTASGIPPPPLTRTLATFWAVGRRLRIDQVPPCTSCRPTREPFGFSSPIEPGHPLWMPRQLRNPALA